MARTWPFVSRCALMIALCAGAIAAASDDLDVRKANQLALQAALREGLQHLRTKHYREAVVALEKKIALIDGNRRYLMALRDAYRGYVQQLDQAGKHEEARTYQRLLAILEPSTQRNTSVPPAVLVVKEQEKPPPEVETVPTPEKPPPPPMPVKSTGVISRGKSEDPFDESPGGPGKGKSSLLASAESAFQAGHYESACQLYARAERAEPGCTALSEERWIYCQMFSVMQSVEVKHTPRQGNGWALAETKNFRIFHAQSEEGADKVARLVEGTRATMMRKRFGEDRGTWSPRCDVFLHPTVKGYTQCKGNPSAASPGHSTTSFDPESWRVVLRRIDVRCDEPNMMSSTLPRETTHVVLAGNFGRRLLPRWADEGMAVLSEPRERINLHLSTLPKHKREDTLFSLGKLMQMQDYPEARLVGPFYAQSVSLVDFLCKKKGTSTFARFLREGLDHGYESALRNHYNYRDISELEREWRQSAFGEAATAAAEKSR